MNKVFKVIWSDARSAYVVVSEIAKNHGSKSCSTKKLLTMLIATGVMTCASMAPAMAAPNVDASATVNVGKKAAVNVAENAKVNVEESAELTVKKGAKVTFSKDAEIGFENGAKINLGSKAGVTLADGAKLSVAKGSNVSVDKNVTIGKGAVSSPYVGQTGNVAIGEKALAWNGNGLQEALMDFGQGGAKVKSFFGIPYGADIVDGTKLPGSIAIGKNTVARSGSTMIGDHGYTGKIGDTTITPDGNGIMKYNNDVYSTTIGANSFNSGALASVTGVFSIASSKYDGENYKFHAVQNTGATIYGSMNSIESATSDAKYSGIASSVLGFANKTQNANAALIWGTGNEVTNSIESIDIDYNGWNKLSVAEAQQKAIEAMQSSKYAGGSVMAIGGGNKADYAKYSQLTGVQNKVTGTEAKTAKYDFVNGYQNTVTNASDVTVIGIKNEVTADGNKVIGDNHKVSGKDNVIFGSADKVTETTVNNAVVLGHNAKVTGEGGVALGSGSVADRANVVSVGRKDANRQIINVAAGTEDTDAVNVSQLKEATANANKGWKLSTEGGAANQVASEATVDFSGQKDAGDHQNITVSNDGNKVKIDLASELHNVTSVVNGDSRVTLGTGVAGITNGQASVVMLNGSTKINNVVGIDNTGKISGVANGEADKDAVNYGQLKDVKAEAEKHSVVTDGANITVTPEKATDGHMQYKVALKNDITLEEDDPDAFVSISGSKGTIWTSGCVTAGSVAVGTAKADGTPPFFVNSNGAFYAADGKFSVDKDGNANANSVQTNALNAKYNLSVGTANENGTVPFFVNSNGAFYAANGKLVVDKDGKVTATEGEIGNVVLKNGVLYKNTALRDGELYVGDADGNYSQITPKSAKLGQVTIDEKGNMAGVNSIQTNALNAKYNLSVGTANENGTVPFFVNSNGAFYAANGKLVVDKDGKVTATEGEIGNVVLKNGVLYKNTALRDGELYVGDADGNYSQITPKSAKLGQVTIDEKGNIAGVNSIQTNALNAKYNLSVGTANENGTVPFFVNSNGAFYGANGSFVVDKDGKVTATAGEIGNVVLQNGVYTGHSALRDGELFVGDASGNYSQITTKGAKLGKVTVAEDGKITGVAAGAITADSTDAVNGSQLHAVQQEAGKHTKVVNGSNITVEETDQDGQKTYKVGLNKDILLGDITGQNVSISGTNGTIETTGHIATKDRVYADKGAKLADVDITKDILSNGPSKVVLNEGYAGMAYGNTNVVLMNNGVYLNGKVNVDKAGQIHNVTAGTADEDAVNVSQLKGVESIANKGWNLSTNGVATAATNVAPGANVDFSGDDNITVSNKDTKVKVALNKNINVNNVQTNALNAKYNLSVGTAADNGTMPFFVNSNGAFYAAGGEFVVDKDGSVKATSGDIGNVKLNNGVFYKNSALRDGELYVADADDNYSQITSKNAKLGKVTIDDTGRISGVEAGRIAADSTDAVNGSQLHAVQQEAGKHTKVVNGSNITVEETDQDGQKTYKVGLNKDILLGDITGKNVSISGTNGTIETTGYIATKDRVYADKGAKLADVDITGDTISNDKSSVKLDKEGTVTVNNKVTIDGNGKVSGVAAGEISNTSTDAVNGSQLKKTNDRVTNVENNVKNIQGDITNIKGDITNIKGDITTIKGDVTILGDRVTKVEQEAGKHTKVVNGSNVTVEETDQDGQKTYKVGLNKDLLLGDITGKNVSISGTNGTIETTGSIATKDKIYADKGAKLADIDITGDTISNGQSSVKLDKEGTVTINGKVSVNQNGKVSGVAAGDISATSTDAVNGGQLYETNQAIANNATNISSLSHSISNLDNRVNKVGAGAAALAALHPLDFDPDAKWDFAAGYGNYRGANAAAVGAYYRPNEDTMFSVGGTFGNGENMVNAGVSFKLGSGSSHVSTSRVAMAKEIKELRGELEAMKSAMLDANAGKKIDTSKLQLFPDVPQNHWAYEYVAQLAGNGMIEGYPDGNFAGDRPMTRYEFAAILYRAMTKGAVLSDKILSEFSHELEYFTVDTIAKDKAGNPTIQRVRTVKENKNK